MFRPSFQSAFALLLSLPLSSFAAPTCQDILVPVTAQSQAHEIILPPNLDGNPNAINDLLNSAAGMVTGLFPLVPITGSYNISAKYCEPENPDPAHADTIQLLVHGATYTKTYWTGLDLPENVAEQYSWIDYASKKGYPTLSIDRPGAGDSTHPDPILELQTNMEAEVMHEIIQKLRNGDIQGKAFSEIIYVGHSLGSCIGSILVQNHPSDVDALVLTGFSTTFLENMPTVLGLAFTPAALHDPERFGDLPLPYLTRGSRAGQRHAFYGLNGTFDPGVEGYDYDTASTITLSELLTVFRGFEPANGFAGAVKLITGEIDTCFCRNGKCSGGPDGELEMVRSLFPDAADFSTTIINRTGHCLNTHYTAEETFQSAHDFFEENGF